MANLSNWASRSMLSTLRHIHAPNYMQTSSQNTSTNNLFGTTASSSRYTSVSGSNIFRPQINATKLRIYDMQSNLVTASDEKMQLQERAVRVEAFKNIFTEIKNKTELAKDEADGALRAQYQEQVYALWDAALDIMDKGDLFEGKLFDEGAALPASIITGTAGVDTLEGTVYNDEISGGDGNDQLLGGYGNDFIYTGSSTDNIGDIVDAGHGDDYIQIDRGAGRAQYDPSQPNDYYYVNPMSAGEGDDYIDASNAILWNNLLIGDEGADSIVGSSTQDYIILGNPDDIYNNLQHNDYIDYGTEYARGGDGSDRIFGAGGDDILFGEAGRDYIYGGHGDDIIISGDENDDSSDGLTHDEAYGGEGNDTIYTSARDYSLASGDTGNDTLYLMEGYRQYADGGDGDDVIYLGSGDIQTGLGGAGDDTVYFGTGTTQYFHTDDGDDTLYGGSGYKQHLYGDAGNDTFFGSSGEEQLLIGGDGNDILYGGSGNKQGLNGGEGDDYLYTGTGTNTILNAGNGNDILNANQGGGGSILGYGGDDTLFQLAGEGHKLYGGSGNDILFSTKSLAHGNDGDDIIIGLGTSTVGSFSGGTGNDIMFMGDIYRWAWAGSGDDTVVLGKQRGVGDSGSDVFYDRKDIDNIVFGDANANTAGAGDDNDVYVFGGNFADYTITDSVGGSGSIKDDVNGHTNTYYGMEYLQFQDGYIDLASGSLTTLHAGKAPTSLDFSLEKPRWEDVMVNGQRAEDFVAENSDVLNIDDYVPSTHMRPDVNTVFPDAPSGYSPSTGLRSFEGTATNGIFETSWVGPAGDWETDIATISSQFTQLESAIEKLDNYQSYLENAIEIKENHIANVKKHIDIEEDGLQTLMGDNWSAAETMLSANRVRDYLRLEASALLQDRYAQSLLSLMDSFD